MLSISYAVKLQNTSASIQEANDRFNESCRRCASCGQSPLCESCPVNGAHNQVVETFRFIYRFTKPISGKLSKVRV